MTTAQHDPRRAERPVGIPLALGARPVVVAPMAGGPTTPELVAAACNAGAFGVLDGASRSAESLAGCLRATRALTDRGFGVNLFVPRKPDLARDEPAVARYAAQLEAEALQYRVAPLPAPDFDLLPSWAGRVGELIRDPVALVSTTFGCPSRELVDALHRVGTSVAVTVTGVAEAECAAIVGADALVVQGCEAGGHRGVHSVRSTPNELTTLHLLGPVAEVGLPMIAAGGIAGPDDVRRVLDAGAVAAQCGTMFLRSDGMLTGPNASLLADVCSRTDAAVIASGGISTLDDLAVLRDMVGQGVEGAIIGTALYVGNFTLPDALAVARGQYVAGVDAQPASRPAGEGA